MLQFVADFEHSTVYSGKRNFVYGKRHRLSQEPPDQT